jgi:hypothetical protein
VAPPRCEADAATILAAVRDAARRVPADGILVVYFAGHAFRQSASTSADVIYLCGVDAQLDNLAQTAISAEQLGDVLRECRARGVLVILDCCISAGFAEQAPAFFREAPAGASFRLLLSASRAHEASYELVDGQGTLFTRHLLNVLTGKTPVGKHPGEISLVGLVDAIEFGVNEDLRETHPNVPAQRAAIAGWFGRDPTIFLHRGNKAAGIGSDRATVSRTLYRRRVRGVGFAMLIAITFSALTYLTIVDKTSYAEADEDVVRLYRGHPRWKAPSYPRLLQERTLSATALKPESPLRRAQPLIARPGKSLEMMLAEQLNEIGAIGDLIVRNRRGDARTRLMELETQISLPPEHAHFARLMLAQVATAEDLPRLLAMLDEPRREVRNGAMAALIRLAPAEAYELLSAALTDSGRFDHRDLLHELKYPCPAGAVAYMTEAIGTGSFSGSYSALADAVVRAGCPFDRSMVTALLRWWPLYEIDDLARYAARSLTAPLKLGEVNSDLAPLRIALFYATAPEPLCLVSPLRMAVDAASVEVLRGMATLLLLSEGCSRDLNVMVESSGHAIRRVRGQDDIDQTTLVVPLPVPGDKSVGRDLIEYLMRYIERSATQSRRIAAIEYLSAIVREGEHSESVAWASEALLRVGVPPMPEQSMLTSSSLRLRRAAYACLAFHQPEEARESLFGRVNDGELRDWAELMLTLPRDARELERVRELASGGPRERERATALLSVIGTKEDLLTLAERPDLATMRTLTQYLPARDDLLEIIRQVDAEIAPASHTDETAARKPEQRLRSLLANAHEHRNGIELELERVGPDDRGWRAAEILQNRGGAFGISFQPVLNAGSRFWLAKEAARRGELSDGASFQ